MKVGFGVPGPLIEPNTFQFARQAGATHVVVHFVSGRPGEEYVSGWSGTAPKRSYARDDRWSYESLVDVRSMVESAGLQLEAIENFAPADWSDVLLDGPRKDEQLAYICDVIRDVGRAGIPTMGYNFSVAGIWGRVIKPVARGGALAPAFEDPEQPPIPLGMVWNQVYDEELYNRSKDRKFLAPITSEQLWGRYSQFLAEVAPVAEGAGVVLALHPDDPPLPTVRGTARLVHSAQDYQRILDVYDTPTNALEFCVGTLSEMPDDDIYEVVRRYCATGRISYVHLRNVRGRAPRYCEVFVDEGYVDMQRVLAILHAGGFDGVVIPDHTPLMTCGAPWFAGMAYAVGWIRASLQAIGALDE